MSVQLQAGKDIAKVTAKDIFEDALPKAFQAMKSQAEGVKATYVIHIFGDGGGHWFVDPKNGTVSAYEKGQDADCVLEMGTDEFSQLTQGKLDSKAALESGRMRFSGNPDHLVALGAFLGG